MANTSDSKSTGTNTNRNAHGQFTFGKFDRVCKCGRRLGAHDAERPFAFGDLSLDPRPLPPCEGFKPQKGVFMTKAELTALVQAAGLDTAGL